MNIEGAHDQKLAGRFGTGAGAFQSVKPLGPDGHGSEGTGADHKESRLGLGAAADGQEADDSRAGAGHPSTFFISEATWSDDDDAGQEADPSLLPPVGPIQSELYWASIVRIEAAIIIA